MREKRWQNEFKNDRGLLYIVTVRFCQYQMLWFDVDKEEQPGEGEIAAPAEGTNRLKTELSTGGEGPGNLKYGRPSAFDPRVRDRGPELRSPESEPRPDQLLYGLALRKTQPI
jgi:hypothetical protein